MKKYLTVIGYLITLMSVSESSGWINLISVDEVKNHLECVWICLCQSHL